MKDRTVKLTFIPVLWLTVFVVSAVYGKEGRVDPFMGEYVGTYTPEEGKQSLRIKALVVPEKHGMRPLSYRVRVVIKDDVAFDLYGKPEDGKVPVEGNWKDRQWVGVVEKDKLTASCKGAEKSSINLSYTKRESPTKGLEPPENAVVLLPFEPGTRPSLDEWTNKNWKPLPDGSVQVFHGSTRTVRDIGASRIHLEFRTPFVPYRFGQGRGNSGVYLNGNYEVQVLDSFGWEAKDNLCGGIYKAAVPEDKYASLPPSTWQTYDVTIYPARVDFNGNVIQLPLISVLHNGIPIHKKVSPEKPTSGSITRSHAVNGPLLLQDHGNPVKYRDIWYVELEDPRPWPEGHPEPVDKQLEPFDAALKKAVEEKNNKARNRIRALTRKTEDYPAFSKPIEKRFLKVLRPDLDLSATSFITSQLKIVATQRALSVLVPMLDNPETFSMALEAMEKIESGKLDKLLRNRLKNAGSKPGPELVQLIGKRRDQEAVPVLSELVHGKDTAVAKAASKALGLIASRDAVEALLVAVEKTKGDMQKVHYTSLLKSAEELLDRDANRRSFRIYSRIYSSSPFVPVREAALRGLVKANREKAGEKILNIVKGSGTAMHGQAVSLVHRLYNLNHVSRIIELRHTLEAKDQVKLIRSLSRRIDDLSREGVLLATRSEHPEVRIAALRALRSFGNENHVYLLAYIIASAEGGERKTATETLRRIRGPNINSEIVDRVKKAKGSVKAALLHSIGTRRIRGVVDLVFSNARSENGEVRTESFFALGRIAGQRDMPRLVQLLLEAESTSDLKNIENATAMVGRRIGNKKERGKAIWNVIGDVKDPRCLSALVRILGKIKDETALGLFRKNLQKPDVMLRRAAITALTSLESLKGLGDLISATEKDPDPDCRLAALRGWLHLMKLPSERKKAATLKLLRRAEAAAKTPLQKKVFLSALPDFKSEEVLEMAKSYLKDKKVAEKAKAVVKQLRKLLDRNKK